MVGADARERIRGAAHRVRHDNGDGTRWIRLPACATCESWNSSQGQCQVQKSATEKLHSLPAAWLLQTGYHWNAQLVSRGSDMDPITHLLNIVQVPICQIWSRGAVTRTGTFAAGLLDHQFSDDRSLPRVVPDYPGNLLSSGGKR